MASRVDAMTRSRLSLLWCVNHFCLLALRVGGRADPVISVTHTGDVQKPLVHNMGASAKDLCEHSFGGTIHLVARRGTLTG